MKLFRILIMFILMILVIDNVQAEKYPKVFDEVEIRIYGGKYNPETRQFTYKTVVNRKREKKLYILCAEKGDNPCPVHLDVFITVISGINQQSDVVQSLDIMKRNILEGKDKGKFTYNDVLYSYQGKYNDKLNNPELIDYPEEKGFFEFEIIGIPIKDIAR